MPNYLFESLDKSETTLLFYSMKEAPKVGSVVKVDGKKWRRIFTLPQAAPAGLKPIDPHSQKAFREKTGSMKGTLGDMWDLSKELSAKRAEKEGGEDPIQNKYLAEYKKKRRGTPHTAELSKNQKKAQKQYDEGLKKLGIKLGLAD